MKKDTWFTLFFSRNSVLKQTWLLSNWARCLAQCVEKGAVICQWPWLAKSSAFGPWCQVVGTFRPSVWNSGAIAGVQSTPAGPGQPLGVEVVAQFLNRIFHKLEAHLLI